MPPWFFGRRRNRATDKATHGRKQSPRGRTRRRGKQAHTSPTYDATGSWDPDGDFTTRYGDPFA
jgi:hypothetical protein